MPDITENRFATFVAALTSLSIPDISTSEGMLWHVGVGSVVLMIADAAHVQNMLIKRIVFLQHYNH